MFKQVFITGTDTDIGKTYVSCMLLQALNQYGFRTVGLKPIASGCYIDSDGHLKNKDALKLLESSSLKQDYAIVNPIRYGEPIAPHIAAAKKNSVLSVAKMKKILQQSMSTKADIYVIEGVGGWAVPLNESELFNEVIMQLNMPVILVVGIKLGCLNHALLTYQNIKAKECQLIGWVANCIRPETLYIEENIMTLKAMIDAPCLGIIPYQSQDISKIKVQAILKKSF